MAIEATITKRKSVEQQDIVRHDARSIESDLQLKIQSRYWARGQKLPSRRELATEYGVALATIERACAKLITSGVLIANGRGTVVSEDATLASATAQRTATTSALPLLSKTIGVINILDCGDVPRHDGNGWTEPVTSALEGTVAKMGGRTIQFVPTTLPSSFRGACESVLSRGVDAIVIVGLGVNIPIDEELAAQRLHDAVFVCITPYDFNLPAPAVFFDNWTAGYQAAEHMLAEGQTKLTYVGPADQAWSNQRLEGARAAAVHFGLDRVNVVLGSARLGISPYDEVELAVQVGELLGVGSTDYRTTGIVAANDSIALGVQTSLGAVGLKAGRDYLLTGFDNAPQSREADITTIRPPLEDLGAEAAGLLADYLQGQRRSTKASLRCQLVIRGSSTAETRSQ